MKTLVPPKRSAATTVNGSGARSPQNGAESKAQPLTLQAASQAIDETLRRALSAAGGLTEAEFRKLPKDEQNAFLAQASGQVRTGVDPNEERKILDTDHVFRSPWNREHFNEEGLEQITESVRQHGVLSDVLVRPAKRELLDKIVDQIRFDELVGKGIEPFELIFGERRWRAATAAAKPLPAKIRRHCSDEEAIELQAIENLQREDPNPIETAAKYQQLMDVYAKRGLTKDAAIEEIRKRCSGGRDTSGPSRSAIYDALRLLKLPDEAKKACLAGKLPASHARELSKLEEDRDELLATFQVVMQKPKGVGQETRAGASWQEVEREGKAGLMGFRDTQALVANRLQFLANRREYNKVKAEFEGRGSRRILDPEKSREIVQSCDTGRVDIRHSQTKFYVAGNTTADMQGANYRNYDKLWKKAPDPVLAMAPNGLPAIIYVRAEADQAVKEGGKLAKDSSGRATSKSPAEKAKEVAHKNAVMTFRLGLLRVFQVEGEDAEKPGFWRLFVGGLLEDASSDAMRHLCAVRGIKGVDSAALKKLVAAMDDHQLRAFALQLVVAERCQPSTWSEWKPDFLKSICVHEKIDFNALKAEAQRVQPSGRKGKK